METPKPSSNGLRVRTFFIFFLLFPLISCDSIWVDSKLNKAEQALENNSYQEVLKMCNEELALHQDPDWLNLRGICYLKMSQAEKALKDFEQELSLRESKGTYSDLCQCLWRLGRLEEAKVACNKALEIDKKYGLAYHNLGWVYFDLGELELALESFNKGISLSSWHAGGYSSRAAVKIMQGDFQGAIADCERAIELDPKDPDGYLHRGMAWYSMGEYNTALYDLDLAHELAPMREVIYYDYGLIYRAQEQYDQALANFSKCLELNPAYYQAYIERSGVYYHLGEYTKSISDMDIHLSVWPDDGDAYFLKALTMSAGKIGDPCPVYEQALSLGQADAAEFMALSCN